VHLLTGGGGGVMATVSEAFCEVSGRAGSVIGVVPGSVGSRGHERPPGYPNPWVEIAIFTHLPQSGVHGTEPLSRNHVNVLSADVVVALPGGSGTASEVTLALRYGKPIVAYLSRPQEIPGLPAAVAVRAHLDGVTEIIRSHLA
jgi:uncharacterized protein (TIGR00725 family)